EVSTSRKALRASERTAALAVRTAAHVLRPKRTRLTPTPAAPILSFCRPTESAVTVSPLAVEIGAALPSRRGVRPRAPLFLFSLRGLSPVSRERPLGKGVDQRESGDRRRRDRAALGPGGGHQLRRNRARPRGTGHRLLLPDPRGRQPAPAGCRTRPSPGPFRRGHRHGRPGPHRGRPDERGPGGRGRKAAAASPGSTGPGARVLRAPRAGDA